MPKPKKPKCKQYKKGNKINAKPFVKWAGGKTQILDELAQRLPVNIKNNQIIDRYIEPFVGGGALFFFLKSRYTIKEAYLLDNNKDLMVCFKVIQNNPKELIKKLKRKENRYLRKTNEKRRAYYYRIRKRFNNQQQKFDNNHYSDEWIKRAAYLIFLNKTCFNGLYRLNTKGEFNVPYGKHKNLTIVGRKNIFAINQALKNTKIYCTDFTRCKKYVREGTLVYFDPPYRPLSITSKFTGFTTERFTDDDQRRLAAFYRELAKRKDVYLMLSNSDPKNEDQNDDFFDKLYKGFRINRISAKRIISCKGSGRGKISELVILNY